MTAQHTQPSSTPPRPKATDATQMTSLDEVLRWASSEGPAERYAGFYAFLMGLNHEKRYHGVRGILDFELQDRTYREEVLGRTQELLALLERGQKSGFVIKGQLLDTLWPPPHDISYAPEPTLGILPALNIHAELLERRLIVWDAMRAHKSFSPERQEKVRTALLGIGPGDLDRNSDFADAGLRDMPMPLVPQPMETFQKCHGDVPLTQEQKEALRLNHRLERLSRRRLERQQGKERAEEKEIVWFNRRYARRISMEPRDKYRSRRWRTMAKYGADWPILPYQPPHPDPKSLLEGTGLKGGRPLPPPRDRKGLFAAFAAQYPPGSEHLLPKPSDKPLTFLVPLPEGAPFDEPPVPPKVRYKPIIDENHPDIQRALTEVAKLEEFYACFRDFKTIASVEPEPMTHTTTTPTTRTAPGSTAQPDDRYPINTSQPLSSADETRLLIRQFQEERKELEAQFAHGTKLMRARELVDTDTSLSDIKRLENLYRLQELQMETRSIKRRWIRLMKAERYHQYCLNRLEGHSPTPAPKLDDPAPPAPKENPAPTPPPAGGPDKPPVKESVTAGDGELVLERTPEGQLSVTWFFKQRPEESHAGSRIKVLVSDPSTTLESLKESLVAHLESTPPGATSPDGILSPLGQRLLELGPIAQILGMTLSKGFYNLNLADNADVRSLVANGPGIAVRIRGSVATFHHVAFWGTAVDVELERATWTDCVTDTRCVMKGSLGQSTFDATSQLHCDATRTDLRHITIEGEELTSRLSKMLFKTELFPQHLREKLRTKSLSNSEWDAAQRSLNESLGREALRDLVLSLDSENRLRKPTTTFTYTEEARCAPRSACDKVEIRTHDDYNRLSFLVAGPQDQSPCRLTLDTYAKSSTRENYFERVDSLVLWKGPPVHYHQALFDMLDLFFDDTLNWPFIVGKKRKKPTFFDPVSGVSQVL